MNYYDYEKVALFADSMDVSHGAAKVVHGMYCLPNRFYHHFSHIEDCLAKAKEIWPDDLKLRRALAFHDVVYHPLAKDNEENSAMLAYSIFEDADITEAVRSTKNHTEPARGLCSRTCDIDMSILAADEMEYFRYVFGVKKEFTSVGVTDMEFTAGRYAFLRGLLERKRLFYTDELWDLEDKARANIKREVTALETHRWG